MAAMGEEMLEETAIFGDLETVAAGLEERRQLGVDLPVITMPQGDPRTLEHVLGTLVS
jgi:alkanesulfonate monooxygenase SsuD/methylene tetrahydromethanopterin reductase-like flavin-dependent oxidoreductase (luciferase family)